MEKSKKVMILGIDGLPSSLIENYINKGLLPEFKKILDSNFRLHKMEASIPDVSSTSWTSFMTGVNPGEHGIYGFIGMRPQSYNMFFPSSAEVTAPTLWEILGKNARAQSTLSQKYSFKNPLRSIVMNVPQTYPAKELNGILTAGFVCPDMRKGTYPESAYSYLSSIGYLSDINAQKAVTDRETFFKETFVALDKRLEAYEHLMTGEKWDLFIGVITETDRIHHFFFDAVVNESHPCHNIVVSFYKKLDTAIGKLYSRFMDITDSQGLFMTMSDHGFTVVEQEVNVNAWLKENGYLKLNKSREYYDRIDSETVAFAMDPARIYLNLEGKFPRGSVKGADKERICSELKEKLLSMKDQNGKRVIKAVLDNRELYKGPQAAVGPEMVCLANDGFDLKSSLDKENVFGKGPFTGMHTQYDAHCILPKNIETQPRLHIEHLADFILGYLKTNE